MDSESKQKLYWQLARHLEQLPGGFGTQDPVVERRLLENLFTVEEAELALHTTLEGDDAAAIAARVGRPNQEVQDRLEVMAQKGLIFSSQSENGVMQYQAIPWVVGIYEFQVNRLDGDLLRDINAYWQDQKSHERAAKQQMRTIPIRESIDVRLEVLPYEHLDRLLAEEDQFAVAPCICRHIAKLSGGGCDAPLETCLIFGAFAAYYIRTGRGKPIDRSELEAILKRANQANLVLQPSNSKKPAFICCCCGCCCGVLSGIQQHPRPADVILNAFTAQLAPGLCENCEICLERCQMSALSPGDGHVILNPARCIGCGLCVSTCPTGALTLIRKTSQPDLEPPQTFDDAIFMLAKKSNR